MQKIGFLYSGSGAQYPGMMQSIYENIPKCRDLADKMSDAYGNSITEICFSQDENRLNEPMNMFIALFSTELVINKALEVNGIVPDIALGFSLGEWAAITAAKTIDLEKAVKLIKIRSEAMIANTPEGAGMLVVLGQSNDIVDSLCSEIKGVYPSNYNYDGQVTISGTKEGLNLLEQLGKEKGILMKRIPVKVMSHCPMMKEASDVIASALNKETFYEPAFPIISNCTAKVASTAAELKQNLVNQLVKPVLFEKSLLEMIASGVTTVVEVGPGHTLCGFAKKIVKKNDLKLNILHVEDMESLYETIEAIQEEIE